MYVGICGLMRWRGNRQPWTGDHYPAFLKTCIGYLSFSVDFPQINVCQYSVVVFFQNLGISTSNTIKVNKNGYPVCTTLLKYSFVQVFLRNDQELVQSKPQSRPQNQNGKQPKLLMDIIQREHEQYIPVSVIICQTFSKIFFSEITGPIEAIFHVEPPWEEGMKFCINGLGHMTKMAATPRYGKNL